MKAKIGRIAYKAIVAYTYFMMDISSLLCFLGLLIAVTDLFGHTQTLAHRELMLTQLPEWSWFLIMGWAGWLPMKLYMLDKEQRIGI